MESEQPQPDPCADLPILKAALAYETTRGISMGSKASSRALQRKDLARIIVQATDKQLLVRKQFNAASTICAIPTEILNGIFTILRDLYVYSSSFPSTGDGAGSDCLRWTNVTHVCSRWREIALGDASLWSCDLGAWKNRDWIDEMLERARNAPLSIGSIPYHGAIPTHDGPQPLEIVNYVQTKHPLAKIIAPHISRVASLAIHGENDIYDILETYTDPPTLLEDLALRVHATRNHGFLWPLPRNLFSNRVPANLRRLKLGGFEPPWHGGSKLMGPTIKDLSVHYPNYGSEVYKTKMPSSLPTLEVVVEGLRKMPLLERLNLHIVIPPGRSLMMEREPPPYLENLRHLTLYSDVGDCVAFLQALRFSSSTSMKLSLQGGKNDDFSALTRLLADHITKYASARSDQPAWLVKADPMSSSYSILSTTTPKDRHGQARRELGVSISPCLTLETTTVGQSIPIAPETIQKGFFGIICSSIASDVEEVHLRHSINARNPRYWIELFGRMRRVRRFRLQHETSPYFVDALDVVLSRVGDVEDEGLFPYLESIEFDRVHDLVKPKPRPDVWRSRYRVRPAYAYTKDDSRDEGQWFWEDLYHVLDQRKTRYNHRLKKIHLRKCRITNGMVSAFDRLVEDVVVEDCDKCGDWQ